MKLSVKNLTKQYEERQIVKGISFEVQEGEIIGLIGANGAGKSTSIRMITGLEKADAGEVIYQNHPIEKNYRQYQHDIGVVPQEIAIYQDMNAYDNVKFFCSLYGYDRKETRQRVEEALRFVGLWEHRREISKKYSGGMKRRLNIACAIAHSPQLLIMDEPTVGIDPQSRNHIMETIRRLQRRGTTVIYVSHYMEEIETLCDRIIFMEKGEIVENCSKEELKEKYRAEGRNSLEEIFLHVTGTALRDEITG